ncbi:hypothetical protein ACKKBG_A29140 [Auxenochlorella protothecoides x Auxenochlorella symbiontica]
MGYRTAWERHDCTSFLPAVTSQKLGDVGNEIQGYNFEACRDMCSKEEDCTVHQNLTCREFPVLWRRLHAFINVQQRSASL